MEGISRFETGSYLLADADATHQLGKLFAGSLKPGDVVVLSGDLGAGKTCFTGGVAAGLGDSRPVTSPTFTIMTVHDGGSIPLYHFDLYRLDDADQLDDVGLYDALEGDGACLIEWGERFADEIGDDRLDLVFTRDESAAAVDDKPEGDEPPRRVVAHPHGTRAQQLAQAFDSSVQSFIG